MNKKGATIKKVNKKGKVSRSVLKSTKRKLEKMNADDKTTEEIHMMLGEALREKKVTALSVKELREDYEKDKIEGEKKKIVERELEAQMDLLVGATIGDKKKK